jgi:type II secretory pathway component PulM
MQEDRPLREPREPRLFGLIPRERAYLILMGTCLLLIVLAWTLIWRYSTVAAVAMSAVALVIPPVAAIIGNAGPVNRQ